MTYNFDVDEKAESHILIEEAITYSKFSDLSWVQGAKDIKQRHPKINYFPKN
jgi:hypothetical protein